MKCLTFDAIVLGGGPAASSAAIELCRQGARVIVIWKSKPTLGHIGETIPPEAVLCFEELGLNAARLLRTQTPVFQRTSAWTSSYLDTSNYILNPYGPAWRLNRPVFDHDLRSAAVLNGATLVKSEKVRLLSREPTWAIGYMSGLEAFTAVAPWIIDCTGRSRWLIRQLGARTVTLDKLAAVGLEFYGTRESEPSTMVEAVTNGWWYSAQTQSKERIAVFYSAYRDSIVAARERYGFLQLLAQTTHVRRRTDRYPSPGGKPWIVIANSSIATPTSGDGWLSAGDACATVDPLSSMGIINALRTGIAAAETIRCASARRVKCTALYDLFVSQLYRNYLALRKTYYSSVWGAQNDSTSNTHAGTARSALEGGLPRPQLPAFQV
jgi:flavin-dependent dehydrogenase